MGYNYNYYYYHSPIPYSPKVSLGFRATGTWMSQCSRLPHCLHWVVGFLGGKLSLRVPLKASMRVTIRDL